MVNKKRIAHCGVAIVAAVFGAVAVFAGELPFRVEYKPSHPFLAEYNKKLVFNSGKAITLKSDTGGAGAFAVYSLSTNEYYIVDGLDFPPVRNDYRVNTAAETVEMMTGEFPDGRWLGIPEDVAEFLSWDGGSFGYRTKDKTSKYVNAASDTPFVGDTLKNRRFIGEIRTNGRFYPMATNRFENVIEPKWEACEHVDGVPFILERNPGRNSFNGQPDMWRVVFPSGKTALLHRFLAHDWFRLYSYGDGDYMIVGKTWRNKSDGYASAYPTNFVSIANETVEYRSDFNGAKLVTMPPDGRIDAMYCSGGDCVVEICGRKVECPMRPMQELPDGIKPERIGSWNIKTGKFKPRKKAE